MNDAASKLFRVIVVGGISMALPACSAGTTQDQDAAASDAAAADAADEKGASQDATADVAAPVDAADDAPCLNKPGDCSHGTCAW